MHRRRGFTLVELLVVIGIIAILIGVLLPALQKVQQQAKMVQCLSITRTLAQAAHIHAADHKGFWPIAGLEWHLVGGRCDPAGLEDKGERKYTYYTEGSIRRPAPMSVALGLKMSLKVRVGDRMSMQTDMYADSFRKQFKCPAQDVVPLGATQRGEDGWSAPLEYLSYTFNEAVLGRRDWSLATPQGNSTRVKRPSSVVLFCDGLPRNQSELWFTIFEAGADWTLFTYYDATKTYYSTFDFKRHRGKMNAVYCDDHAETITLPNGLRSVGLSLGIYK